MHPFVRSVSLCLLLFNIHTNTAQAHAVVTEHSLKISTVSANQASQVKLLFNSSIEIGLSQVFLVRAGDIEEPLSLSAGIHKGEVFIAMPALSAGKYALHYKIFAADGHLTDDIIHFNVQP